MAKRSFIDRIRPCPELRRRPIWAVAGLALFAAGVSVAAIPAGGFDRNPKISAVRAYADAHVSVSAQNANYGKQRGLTVDARPLTRAYVRFGIDLEKRERRARQPDALQPHSLANGLSGAPRHGHLA